MSMSTTVLFWAASALAMCGITSAALGASLINTYVGGHNEPIFGFYNGTPTPSIIATASESYPDVGAEDIVNGNGFWTVPAEGPAFLYVAPAGPTFRDSQPNGRLPEHSNGQGSWFSKDSSVDGADTNLLWVSFALPDRVRMDSMKVWNYYPPSHNRGVQSAYIWYSMALNPSISPSTGGASPGPDWVMLGTEAFTFPNTTDDGIVYDSPFTINFGNVAARHILIDIETNYGDVRTGLAEIQFFGTPVPEPVSAACFAAGMIFCGRAGGRRRGG
jgi:hypothetical protein